MILMKRIKRVRTVPAAVIAALVALTSCAAPGTTDGASSPSTLTVAVAFYPFAFVAQRVGGAEVHVDNLTAPGAEPHDLELTPRQVAGLATADLVVFQSGFQPAIDAAIPQASPKRTVDSASFLTLLAATDSDGRAGSAKDPHTWLAPSNLVTITEHVRDALIEARPAASQTFTANAATLIGELTALDTEFRTGLATCAIRPFVTSHAAFGYLAHAYNLEQIAVRGLEPDTEPTAARIAEVQRLATANHVTTIFFETLVSPVVSESIAADLGLVTDVLDPIEGITADSRGTDYLEVMGSNLTALRKANQCS